jgi:spore maturation protein SpmB
MRSYPGDLTAVVFAVAGALVLMVVLSRPFRWYRLRALRLCLLTGTRPQHAALRVALAPVLREFLPVLDKTGQDVRAIILVPTLSGSDREPLLTEVEQASGSDAFIIRLAHRLGGTLRQPDEVAAALAEDLLYLYRHAAAVTIVRQTSPSAGLDVATQNATSRKPVGRNGLVALPNAASQKEAEETVTHFKASPHGRNNNQGS